MALLCPIIFVPKISLIGETGRLVRTPLRGHVTAACRGVEGQKVERAGSAAGGCLHKPPALLEVIGLWIAGRCSAAAFRPAPEKVLPQAVLEYPDNLRYLDSF